MWASATVIVCVRPHCAHLWEKCGPLNKKGIDRNILKGNNAFLSTSFCFGRLTRLWSTASTTKLESQGTVSFRTVAHNPFPPFMHVHSSFRVNAGLLPHIIFLFLLQRYFHLFASDAGTSFSNTHRFHAISVEFLESKSKVEVFPPHSFVHCAQNRS